MNILSIGEVMVEMSHIEKNIYLRKFAGDTFNVIYYAKMIAPKNWKFSYLTAVGNDKVSEELVEFIREHNIETNEILKDKDRTLGLFILSNNHLGEKEYIYWRGQSAAKNLFHSVLELKNYNIVYFSGITAAIIENKHNLITTLKRIKNSKAKLIYDFNYRKQLWSREKALNFSQNILSDCEFIKISDEELIYLLPTLTIKDLSLEYPKAEIVFTCGNKNSQTWKNGILKAQAESVKIKKVIDSSAAGDCFIGIYMVSRFKGKTEKEALIAASKIAGQVVQEKGSLVPIKIDF